MSLLSPSEAAAIAAVVRDASIAETSVKVLRATAGSRDAEGRRTLSWPNPATVTAVGGRVWLASIRENRDGIWVQTAEWRARVTLDTRVDKGDRLYDVETDRLYEVRTVAPKNSLVGTLYQELTLLSVEGSVL